MPGLPGNWLNIPSTRTPRGVVGMCTPRSARTLYPVLWVSLRLLTGIEPPPPSPRYTWLWAAAGAKVETVAATIAAESTCETRIAGSCLVRDCSVHAVAGGSQPGTGAHPPQMQ